LSQDPKISAFIFTYNQEKYIEDTLESVLQQNYNNIEIVVGDDGSKDGTVEILKRYQKEYPGIIKLILSPENTGITANCNRILQECTGEFIAILGGDDIWLPNKLHAQVAWFNENPDHVLCFTLMESFYSETNESIGISPSESIETLTKLDTISKTMALGANGSSFLIRASAIPKEGFNALIPMVSDFLFYVQIIHNKNIGGINEVLTRYRRHTNNISSSLGLIRREHYLSLQLIKQIFPDLREEAERWEKIILRELIIHNGDILLKAINPGNAEEVWQKASASMKSKRVAGLTIKLLFRKLIKSLSRLPGMRASSSSSSHVAGSEG